MLNKFIKLSLNIFYINKKKSFGLVETAITVAIIGTLAGSGIVAYRATNPQLKSDLKKIKAIQEAMNSFFSVNGRLPKPASITELSTQSTFLAEKDISPLYTYTKEGLTDGILFGAVPVRTLGLSDDYAYDSRGHNFEYWTHSVLTDSNGSANGEYVKDYYVSGDGDYNVYYKPTSAGDTAKHFSVESLSVKNIQHNTTTNSIAYAIVSKQKSTCWYNNKGNSLLKDTTIPSGELQYNCSLQNPSSSRELRQGYSADFDNIVIFSTLQELSITSYKANESMAGVKEKSGKNGYYNALPKGTMVMFYLDRQAIPRGWQICDGTNNTPDMRGVVAVGWGDGRSNQSSYTGDKRVGDLVGNEENKVVLNNTNIPNHTHNCTATDEGHEHKLLKDNAQTNEIGLRVYYDNNITCDKGAVLVKSGSSDPFSQTTTINKVNESRYYMTHTTEITGQGERIQYAPGVWSTIGEKGNTMCETKSIYGLQGKTEKTQAQVSCEVSGGNENPTGVKTEQRGRIVYYICKVS